VANNPASQALVKPSRYAALTLIRRSVSRRTKPGDFRTFTQQSRASFVLAQIRPTRLETWSPHRRCLQRLRKLERLKVALDENGLVVLEGDTDNGGRQLSRATLPRRHRRTRRDCCVSGHPFFAICQPVIRIRDPQILSTDSFVAHLARRWRELLRLGYRCLFAALA
jgi:hypothetical protein